jgi:DNA-binding transcriptional LysR family regulator
LQEKRLQAVKIHSDEIKVLVPPHHPLAGRGFATAADVAGYPLLMPKTGMTRSRLAAWLEPVEDQLRISMELDSTEMIKRFVLAGLGAGFIAGAHCREEVAAGRLAAIPLGPEPMERQIGLIYRKDKALSKAALGFIEVTLAHAGEDPLRLPVRPAGAVERVKKPAAEG